MLTRHDARLAPEKLREYPIIQVRYAGSAYRKAYALDPSDWHALMAIGNCYEKLRMPMDAARSLHRAISLCPQSAELQYNLGNALFDMGRLKDAVKWYRKAQRASGKVRKLAERNEKRARTCIRATERGR